MGSGRTVPSPLTLRARRRILSNASQLGWLASSTLRASILPFSPLTQKGDNHESISFCFCSGPLRNWCGGCVLVRSRGPERKPSRKLESGAHHLQLPAFDGRRELHLRVHSRRRPVHLGAGRPLRRLHARPLLVCARVEVHSESHPRHPRPVRGVRPYQMPHGRNVGPRALRVCPDGSRMRDGRGLSRRSARPMQGLPERR
jgi:hypothetical protein